MKNFFHFLLTIILVFSVPVIGFGQVKMDNATLRFKLNENGSRYVQAVFMNQTWVRFNESNPGSLKNGVASKNSFDIGLRRTRFQVYGEVANRTFLYFQFGQNNFNSVYNATSNRKLSFFIHDAYSEYRLSKGNELKVGAGLTIHGGLSRFTQPSVNNALAMDIPVFAQTTVDQTDQFARKLSVFARGQVGKLDYRLVLSDPFVVTSNGQTPPALSANSGFSPRSQSLMSQGFFMYQFLEHENHLLAFMPGTYLGSKKVFNIAGGFIYQPKAMWQLKAPGDTAYPDMKHWAVESFLDIPLNKQKRDVLSFYLGYFNTNYGPNYLRYVGIMNPTTSTALTNANSISGHGPVYGNAFPMMGTGKSVYTQFGYLLPVSNPDRPTRFMPYVTGTFSKFERLSGISNNMYHAGLNIFLNGQKSKITLDLQNRAVFSQRNGLVIPEKRKNQLTAQFHLAI